MAQTPGFRLKVLASGLHQLATKCDKVSGELAADAKPPALRISGWQSSAATAQSAADGAGKDLSGIARQMHARGTHFNTAATAYTHHDQHGAKVLGSLGR
jgi:hypothetical protein